MIKRVVHIVEVAVVAVCVVSLLVLAVMQVSGHFFVEYDFSRPISSSDRLFIERFGPFGEHVCSKRTV